MKNLILRSTTAVLVAISLTSLMACGQSKPTKTIESLRAAYNGESTASAKYAKFAQKASEEGYANVAKMFEATSKAESIHAGNHKKVLEKLGENIGAPNIGAFEVKTTSENLADGIKGESYEVDSMYPEFISIAKNEKSEGAVESFTWAFEAEKKHKEFYQKALDRLAANNGKQNAVKWYVCSICGNTYDEQSVKNVCELCAAPKEKFIEFFYEQSKSAKTIENLKAAYNGESTASAKYAKFAQKAKEEGYENVAKMFEATSKAESIHAGNHKKVLAKLGENIGAPNIGKFEVKTTSENLADGIKGESYEVDSMYPEFISIAKNEKSEGAVESFTWAIEAEKKHKEFYQKALDGLAANKGKQNAVKWYVCSLCGNTYDEQSVKNVCELCASPKEKFIGF